MSLPERAIASDIAIGASITCDPDRLAQLLSNLLANALFTFRFEVGLLGDSDRLR